MRTASQTPAGDTALMTRKAINRSTLESGLAGPEAHKAGGKFLSYFGQCQ